MRELYGSGGEAAQLAFKGWIVDVFALGRTVIVRS